ncbi:MAG TPA: iron-sulfur cluster assembly accessory protein [Rhabdochlamydiaceae bacterium]|jgi:iron-sulfur cluster assembly accessory protein
MKNKITKEMTIEEIFSRFPQKSQKLGQEMTNTGLHCVGCGAATWETLEMGMLSHGYAQKEIDDLVGRLNAILEEEVDISTISLTPRAAQRFISILKEENKEGWGLRFGIRAGGCSGYEYILDYSQNPEEGDSVFTSEKVAIHVNKQMVDRLMGSQIDYVDGLQGSGFKISNPNAKGACGCGKSQNY